MTICRPTCRSALGAGETTLLRMVTAYAMFDNGGRRIKPTLIDRIQDRYGHTVYKHDERECIGCDVKKWENQPEPSLIDRREQVLDPMTAYQITSMMEGVVQRGTATVVREVGKPVAGKTGTTNDEKDAWFIGFTPDIVVGVYMGLRQAAPLGRGATGGHLVGADREGLPESRACRQAGRCRSACRPASSSSASTSRPARAQVPATSGSILEAFKPGTAPPGRLLGGRLWRRRQGDAAAASVGRRRELGRRRSRRALGHRRAVLTPAVCGSPGWMAGLCS